MSGSLTPPLTTIVSTHRPQASRGDMWLPQSTVVDGAFTTSSHFPSRVDIQERHWFPHPPFVSSIICYGFSGVLPWCTDICHCPTGSAASPGLSHTSSWPPVPITPSTTFPSPAPPLNSDSSDPLPPSQSTPTAANNTAPSGSPSPQPSMMTSTPGSNKPGSSNTGTSNITTTTVTATPSIYPYSGQITHSPESALPSSTTSDRASSLPSSSLSSSSRRFPLGAIIGITLAVAITLLLLGVWWWRRRLRRARSWVMLAGNNNDQLTEVSYGYSSWLAPSVGYTTRAATPVGVWAASVLSHPAESHFRDSLIHRPPPLSPRTPLPLPFERRTSGQPDVPRDITPNGSVREVVRSKGAGVVMAPERALSLSTSLFSDGASSKHMSLRPQ
ncbi:hypothetical protein C8Q74DRAFT_983236 [Fomes fomentarius]|nr:hypothetical protein C8Q74DRAFT_983236 [Fomes fomentarius]